MMATGLLSRLQACGRTDLVPPDVWRDVDAYLEDTSLVESTPEALASLRQWWKVYGALLVGRSEPPRCDPSDPSTWAEIVRRTMRDDKSRHEWPAGATPGVRELLASDAALMEEDDATLVALLEQSGIAPKDCAVCARLLRRDHARLRRLRDDAKQVRFDVAPPRLRLGDTSSFSVVGFEALPHVGRAIRRDRQTRRMLRDWVRRRSSTISVAAADRQRYLRRVGRRWEQVAASPHISSAVLRDICEDFVADGLREVGVWNPDEDPAHLRAAWDFAASDSSRGVRLCHWFGLPASAQPPIRCDPDVLLADDPSTTIVFPRHRSWPAHLLPVKLLLCRRANRTREIYEELLELWTAYVIRVCRLPVHDDDDETHPFVRALFARHDSCLPAAEVGGRVILTS